MIEFKPPLNQVTVVYKSYETVFKSCILSA